MTNYYLDLYIVEGTDLEAQLAEDTLIDMNSGSVTFLTS